MIEEEQPDAAAPVAVDKTLAWRRDELRRLGYTQAQRTHLLELMELRELDLHTVQHLGDDLKCPVELAWQIVRYQWSPSAS